MKRRSILGGILGLLGAAPGMLLASFGNRNTPSSSSHGSERGAGWVTELRVHHRGPTSLRHALEGLADRDSDAYALIWGLLEHESCPLEKLLKIEQLAPWTPGEIEIAIKLTPMGRQFRDAVRAGDPAAAIDAMLWAKLKTEKQK